MIEKINEFINNNNFRVLAGILTTAVVVLFIARILSSGFGNDGLLDTGNPEITVNPNQQFEGDFIAGEPTQTKQVITITVDDVNDLSAVELAALKQQALRQNGLNSNQVVFSLESRRGLDSEYGVEFDIELDGPDPTNPTNLDQNKQKAPLIDYEPFEVDWETYADYVKIVTKDYEVYKLGDKRYEVILKGGYPQSEFERTLFKRFRDYQDYRVTYIEETGQ